MMVISLNKFACIGASPGSSLYKSRNEAEYGCETYSSAGDGPKSSAEPREFRVEDDESLVVGRLELESIEGELIELDDR